MRSLCGFPSRAFLPGYQNVLQWLGCPLLTQHCGAQRKFPPSCAQAREPSWWGPPLPAPHPGVNWGLGEGPWKAPVPRQESREGLVGIPPSLHRDLQSSCWGKATAATCKWRSDLHIDHVVRQIKAKFPTGRCLRESSTEPNSQRNL